VSARFGDSARDGRAIGISISAIYGAFFFLAGIQMAYLPTWLASRGLTETDIALVLSIPMLVRVATTPVITLAADRRRQQPRAIVILAWGVLAASCVLALTESFWAILFTMIVFGTFWTAIMPITEALAMRAVRSHNLDYGRMRLWGSLTFIAAGLVGGWSLGEFGPEPVVLIIVAASAALVLAAHQTAATRIAPAAQAAGMSRIGWRDVQGLLMQRVFILLLITSGLGQATHAVYYAFGTIHWQSIGLPATLIGVLWAIGVFAEIVLFMMAKRVIHRIGAARLLLIGVAAGLLRWPIVALDPAFPLLCLVQVLHGLTFGAVHLGAIQLISDLAGEDRAATAQGLHATFAAGIFMALAIAASGPLYETFAGNAYFAMAGLSAAALVASAALVRCLDSGISGERA